MLDNSVGCKSLLAVLEDDLVSRGSLGQKHSVSLGGVDTEGQTESEVRLVMLIASWPTCWPIAAIHSLGGDNQGENSTKLSRHNS